MSYTAGKLSQTEGGRRARAFPFQFQFEVAGVLVTAFTLRIGSPKNQAGSSRRIEAYSKSLGIRPVFSL